MRWFFSDSLENNEWVDRKVKNTSQDPGVRLFSLSNSCSKHSRVHNYFSINEFGRREKKNIKFRGQQRIIDFACNLCTHRVNRIRDICRTDVRRVYLRGAISLPNCIRDARCGVNVEMHSLGRKCLQTSHTVAMNMLALFAYLCALCCAVVAVVL